ncbi:MAG: PKD domain-containing protein, partial [Crocinitomicaceae bacterium]|nr:PKD domain-containing protein [Crocinitomicaceae bacterium]MBT6514084.1 PKD domain-containing protein [Crocinitomicaceae bacterium]
MIFRKLAIILIVIFNSTSFGCLGQAPVSAFSAIDTEGCAPFSVTFINSSVGATSYYWEFGDGTSSINSNPTVTYLTQGLFTVTLIVTDSAGDQDTLVINDFIHVVDDPISDFSAIQLGNCENDNVINFNNESMNASEYLWDFGDGSTVITENPTHTYAEPGSYSVTLIASNAVGCSHVKQIMSIVTIHSLPEVQFSVDQYASCDSNHVYQFTNLTASAVSSFWDFGTGSSSTTISPTNNFSSTGIFDVSLICTNSYGCKDTLTKTDLIENFEEPEIAIYASDFAVCEGDSIVFSDSTNNAVSYYWDLGSGIVDSNSTITKLYLDSGNYVVKLSVTDNNGCIGIDSVLIAVESSPIVDIIPSDSVICSG